MLVLVNGKAKRLKNAKLISYERLCIEANISIFRNPTITYMLPNGRSGSIVKKQYAPVVENAIYEVNVLPTTQNQQEKKP
jgi:hypothetical protein